MKTVDEKYREKLLLMCEKAPEYLSREIHRMLHDQDDEGYIYFMQDFIEEIHLIAGRNVPQLCDAWAQAVLNCKDMQYGSTADDHGAEGD